MPLSYEIRPFTCRRWFVTCSLADYGTARSRFLCLRFRPFPGDSRRVLVRVLAHVDGHPLCQRDHLVSIFIPQMIHRAKGAAQSLLVRLFEQAHLTLASL